MSVTSRNARNPAGRQRSKVRRRTAKREATASRSTSRTISAVVALPCSMSGDHGPPACSVARNRLPSGMKMAVMARLRCEMIERVLRRRPRIHNNRGGYVVRGMRPAHLFRRPFGLFSKLQQGGPDEHLKTASDRYRVRRRLPVVLHRQAPYRERVGADA